MSQLFDLLAEAKVYDLAQPYFTGMPHYPTHPPFLFRLVKQHGDYVGPAGNSSAAESIALGGHVGTHIDAARQGQGVEIRRGDVVLLRTGWAAYWDDPRRFISEVRGPGPGLAGARWLSGHGIFAVGSETVAFEKVPDASMPVHVHLLVENGIHIIECLNLEELATARVYEFLFVAAPLKIRGGTGSPIRPIAVEAR
jgi:kynurenine formamidase